MKFNITYSYHIIFELGTCFKQTLDIIVLLGSGQSLLKLFLNLLSDLI